MNAFCSPDFCNVIFWNRKQKIWENPVWDGTVAHQSLAWEVKIGVCLMTVSHQLQGSKVKLRQTRRGLLAKCQLHQVLVSWWPSRLRLCKCWISQTIQYNDWKRWKFREVKFAVNILLSWTSQRFAKIAKIGKTNYGNCSILSDISVVDLVFVHT